MANVVFLLGNGLGIGVSERFAVPELTARLRNGLATGAWDELNELMRLANPDPAGVALDPATAGFEQLAGPLDRVASVIRALGPLTGSLSDDCITSTNDALRRRYLSIVGVIVGEIVDAAQLGSEDEWLSLNAFAKALSDLHRRHDVTIYTLSYDTLLDSSLLEAHDGWFYDGFPAMELDNPLDRWPNNLAAYHLHGSLLWYQTATGAIRKVTSNTEQHRSLITAWKSGNEGAGLPVLVLTDRKTQAVTEYPFDLFYSQLWTDLRTARRLVIAGYGFGDVPVNSVIAQWVSQSSSDRARSVEIWARNAPAKRGAILDKLRSFQPSINESAVVAQAVELPAADAVAELAGRL